MDEWTFPVGTRIWKEFRLPLGDAGTETRIETRLLWKIGADAAGTARRTAGRTTERSRRDGADHGRARRRGHGLRGPQPGRVRRLPQRSEGRRPRVRGRGALDLGGHGHHDPDARRRRGSSPLPPAAGHRHPGRPHAVGGARLAAHELRRSRATTRDGEANVHRLLHAPRRDTLASVQTTNAYTTGWNVTTDNFEIPGTRRRPTACRLQHRLELRLLPRLDHRDGVDGAAPGTQMPPIDTHLVDRVDVAADRRMDQRGVRRGRRGLKAPSTICRRAPRTPADAPAILAPSWPCDSTRKSATASTGSSCRSTRSASTRTASPASTCASR